MQQHVFVALIFVNIFLLEFGGKGVVAENIDKKLSIFTKDIHQMAQENRLLRKRVKALEDGNRRLLQKRGLQKEVVAFHAYLSQQMTSIGRHHIIRFDHEMTDKGSGYNQHTGLYTVRYPGTYVFSWTVAVKHTMCATQLVRNSEVIGVSYPDSESDADNDTATVTVVKEVNAGDVVYIRADVGCSAIRGDLRIRSSFSGWKL